MSTTFATTVATTVAITVAEYRLAASLQDAASFRRCAELPIKCKLAPCPSQLPGIALALLHLALYDCQGLQLHFSNASLHLALHNCPGLHLHFCTLPSTIARDCSCTLCSCTLHFDTCDVPKRGRERDGNAGEEERKEMPGCPFLQIKKKQLLCYKRENKTFGPICICKNGFVDIGPQRRIFTP